MFLKRAPGYLLLTIGLMFGAVDGTGAEYLVRTSTEARTILHFSANKDAVQKLLPTGWTSTPGTGDLKDANIGIVLIDGLAAESAEGNPVPNQSRLAVLFVPAKNEQSGASGAMIVGGFTAQPEDAPGAYGVYVPAKVTVTRSSRSDGSEATTVEESWDVSTNAGDQLLFAVSYERGMVARTHIEPRIYSAARPEFYRIDKIDQVSEVVHSVVDDTKQAGVEFSGSGPQFSKVFDGNERLVAVTSIPICYRRIFLPD
jgi:hypothetical protein